MAEDERTRETAQSRHDLEETISSYKTRLKNQDNNYRSQIKNKSMIGWMVTKDKRLIMTKPLS